MVIKSRKLQVRYIIHEKHVILLFVLSFRDVKISYKYKFVSQDLRSTLFCENQLLLAVLQASFYRRKKLFHLFSFLTNYESWHHWDAGVDDITCQMRGCLVQRCKIRTLMAKLDVFIQHSSWQQTLRMTDVVTKHVARLQSTLNFSLKVLYVVTDIQTKPRSKTCFST